MADATTLAAVLLLPAAGAALVPFVRAPALARTLALAVMLAVLAFALQAFMGFDGVADASGANGANAANAANAAARYALDVPWMPSLGVSLHFAVDGLNVYLLLLTALLFPAVLLCAWNTREGESRLYLSLLLALQAGLLGTFLSQNLLVLFVLWEAALVPMVLLILVFGGPERKRAAITFFLYTMAGSVLFLAAVIVLGMQGLQQTGNWTFDLATLYRLNLGPRTQLFVFASILLACFIKSPIFPFHSWLPLTYGQASPTGTALLAGVMSKMGAFGLIKLAVPLCPDVAARAAPYIVLLAAASIVYGAVLALRQTQYKQLVAYASLSHMGYIVLGVFSLQATGLHGALFQILSHGLAVAALFLMLGLLDQRRGAADAPIEALATRAPRFAVLMMLFILASLALPLSSGFTAEFMVLLGAFTKGLAAWRANAGPGLLVGALMAATGVVLGATYMLRFARVLMYGNAGNAGNANKAAPLADLRGREALALLPLLALILWVGIWPAPLMSKVDAAVLKLAQPAALVMPTAGAPAQAAVTAGVLHGR